MHLNTINPAPGSKVEAKRLGRGIGSGKGKTCGRGHKGQRARAGGFHRIGFEGGQTALQRRLPKFGFHSMSAASNAEIRLSQLNKLDADVITLDVLRAAGLISAKIKRAKIILSGKVTKAVVISGLALTAGARSAIEAAGGKIESLEQ
jgi:large subunit ribosomal protein L15